MNLHTQAKVSIDFEGAKDCTPISACSDVIETISTRRRTAAFGGGRYDERNYPHQPTAANVGNTAGLGGKWMYNGCRFRRQNKSSVFMKRRAGRCRTVGWAGGRF
jgi:hypothetical protein